MGKVAKECAKGLGHDLANVGWDLGEGVVEIGKGIVNEGILLFKGKDMDVQTYLVLTDKRDDNFFQGGGSIVKGIEDAGWGVMDFVGGIYGFIAGSSGHTIEEMYAQVIILLMDNKILW